MNLYFLPLAHRTLDSTDGSASTVNPFRWDCWPHRARGRPSPSYLAFTNPLNLDGNFPPVYEELTPTVHNLFHEDRTPLSVTRHGYHPHWHDVHRRRCGQALQDVYYLDRIRHQERGGLQTVSSLNPGLFRAQIAGTSPEDHNLFITTPLTYSRVRRRRIRS